MRQSHEIYLIQEKGKEKKFFDNYIKNKKRYKEASSDDREFIYVNTVDKFDGETGKIILDVACGTGANFEGLSKRGFFVVGIDISSVSILEAKKRADFLEIRAGLVIGDVEKMPFKEASFGVCFCGGVFHHLPDMSNLAKELMRITQKQGNIISYDPNGLNPYEYPALNIINKYL